MVLGMGWLSPAIETVQTAHRCRFDALYAGRPTEQVLAIAWQVFGRSHGLGGNNDIDMLSEPERWLDDVISDMASQTDRLADPVVFHPLVVGPDPLGTHYVDALLGAEVHFREGQWWSEPLTYDLDRLARPELHRNPVFVRSLTLARLAVQRTQGKAFITTPVLSCPINVGINLFGERLLEAFIERPRVAARVLRIVTDVILECIRAFSEIVPQGLLRPWCAEGRYAPAGYGELDGCATQLVSPLVYNQFLAELDAQILSAWPRGGGMLHLCGASSQHISAWASMRHVRSVELHDRAALDLELFFGGLRADQIIYTRPSQIIPAIDLDYILRVTGGQRLVLQQVQLAQPIALPL